MPLSFLGFEGVEVVQDLLHQQSVHASSHITCPQNCLIKVMGFELCDPHTVLEGSSSLNEGIHSSPLVPAPKYAQPSNLKSSTLTPNALVALPALVIIAVGVSTLLLL